MADGLAAVRAELGAGLGAVRFELEEGFTSPTGALRRAVAGLRAEIREGDEETRRQMRVQHEDLVSRIAPLQEGWSHSKTRRKDRRPR